MSLRIKTYDASGNADYIAHFMYMLRIDISSNFYYKFPLKKPEKGGKPRTPSVSDKFIQYLDSNFKYYLLGREKSLSGKDHLQCFVIHDCELKINDKNRIRAYIKKHFAYDRKVLNNNPVAFTKAKYPDKLYKYCIKDGNITTNIPIHIIKIIERYAIDKIHDNKKNRWLIIREIVRENLSREGMVMRFCSMVKSGQWTTMPTPGQIHLAQLVEGVITPLDYYQLHYEGRVQFG